VDASCIPPTAGMNKDRFGCGSRLTAQSSKLASAAAAVELRSNSCVPTVDKY